MNAHVRPVEPQLTHALRQRILRPHQPLAEMHYDGDDDAETVHLAAFEGDGEPLGVVSLYRRPMPDDGGDGDWQFRGMAVDAPRQRAGLGRLLMAACFDHARARGGRRLWCNARLTAAGFYQVLGLARRGEIFDPVAIGPHVVMSADLGPGPAPATRRPPR